MQLFLRTLQTDFQRILLSKRFLLSMLAFLAVSAVTLAQEMPYFDRESSVMYIRLMQSYLGFYVVYLLFAAIPGVPVFCTDWENRFYRYTVLRCTKNIYAVSKVIVCAVSAFSLVFLAEWLFIIICRLMGFPLTEPNFLNNLGAYDIFSAPGKTYIYLLIVITIKSACAAFFSVLALWLSTRITNPFVVLAAPILAYELFNTVLMACRVPSVFLISTVAKGQAIVGDSAGISFLYSVLYFTVFTVIFSLLFIRDCKRRIRNG